MAQTTGMREMPSMLRMRKQRPLKEVKNAFEKIDSRNCEAMVALLILPFLPCPGPSQLGLFPTPSDSSVRRGYFPGLGAFSASARRGERDPETLYSGPVFLPLLYIPSSSILLALNYFRTEHSFLPKYSLIFLLPPPPRSGGLCPHNLQKTPADRQDTGLRARHKWP